MKRNGRGNRREYTPFGATLFRNPTIFLGAVLQVSPLESSTAVANNEHVPLVVESVSLARVEDGFQGPEIAVAHDLVELFFRSQEGRGQPADHHLAVLPVGDATGLDAYSGVRALDDVGGRQAAVQRRRDIQPVDGEALQQALQDGLAGGG